MKFIYIISITQYKINVKILYHYLTILILDKNLFMLDKYFNEAR